MTQAVVDFARRGGCTMDVYFVIHPSDWDTMKVCLGCGGIELMTQGIYGVNRRLLCGGEMRTWRGLYCNLHVCGASIRNAELSCLKGFPKSP